MEWRGTGFLGYARRPPADRATSGGGPFSCSSLERFPCISEFIFELLILSHEAARLFGVFWWSGFAFAGLFADGDVWKSQCP